MRPGRSLLREAPHFIWHVVIACPNLCRCARPPTFKIVQPHSVATLLLKLQCPLSADVSHSCRHGRYIALLGMLCCSANSPQQFIVISEQSSWCRMINCSSCYEFCGLAAQCSYHFIWHHDGECLFRLKVLQRLGAYRKELNFLSVYLFINFILHFA
jgi:hypothetical protein